MTKKGCVRVERVKYEDYHPDSTVSTIDGLKRVVRKAIRDGVGSFNIVVDTSRLTERQQTKADNWVKGLCEDQIHEIAYGFK